MTPQERQLIDRLFERLATLETAPRDAEAVRSINAGLERAPNALYPLVQTVLVQEEAIKRADERIRALEAELGGDPGQGAPQGGFLDSMRDALLGRRDAPGSVPPVRNRETVWNNSPADHRPMGLPPSLPGQPAGQPQPAPSAGGSFLGTAAATAAGVLGGAMLMNSLKGLFGGDQAKAQSAFDQPGGSTGSPWDQKSGGDLSREAGLDDIGRGGDRTAAYDNADDSRFGLFDLAQNDDDYDYEDGGDFGDSDLA